MPVVESKWLPNSDSEVLWQFSNLHTENPQDGRKLQAVPMPFLLKWPQSVRLVQGLVTCVRASQSFPKWDLTECSCSQVLAAKHRVISQAYTAEASLVWQNCTGLILFSIYNTGTWVSPNCTKLSNKDLKCVVKRNCPISSNLQTKLSKIDFSVEIHTL